MGPKIDPKVVASVSKAKLAYRAIKSVLKDSGNDLGVTTISRIISFEGIRRHAVTSGQPVPRNRYPSKKNSATLKKIDPLTNKENPPSKRQITKQCQMSPGYVSKIIHQDLVKTVQKKKV